MGDRNGRALRSEKRRVWASPRVAMIEGSIVGPCDEGGQGRRHAAVGEALRARVEEPGQWLRPAPSGLVSASRLLGGAVAVLTLGA
jgi:hypothetical protein